MQDRLKKAERVIKIWVMLHNNPNGYTIKELTEKFDVDSRTIYRDFEVLDQDLKVPIYDDKKRWKLDVKRMLPPVRFTLPEALNIFLASRLMVSYDKHYNPNMDATFSKLASILPQPLGEQVQRTVDWMQSLPRKEKQLQVLTELAEAWTSLHSVKITYRSLESEKAAERIIEPYFIQPAAAGHSSYVIAYCHRAKEVRTFKIERIENIQSTGDTYLVPSDFDANKYLGSAWGVVVGGETKTIRLKFTPIIGRIISETVWHPSQEIKMQKDGTVIMTLQIMDTVELFSWIMGWGENVEVLEPRGLRADALRTAKAIQKIYQRK
ncbi:YafY family protein [Dehalococcoides mccartyi]|uniref:helix-turn-helix transcriptional regulator n=1 Tax=Dehalococcoides mccartyi TaxID=61435 RepID=UPI000870BA9B|nr:WYL domain-containing transcriptional regulator [Dehalococcoides mccartyi]AOV98896.1 transcriptional regulator [Dehalococcoides mccartyi]